MASVRAPRRTVPPQLGLGTIAERWRSSMTRHRLVL
jgi:hypothetical protein